MLSKKTITYIIAGVTGALLVGLTTMCITLVATTDKEFLEDKVLERVSNVEYSPRTSTLKWDSVENATSYIVSINGKEAEVQDNAFKFLPKEQSITYAVRAIDSTNTYKSGEWSTPYRYTLNNTDITYARFNVFAKNVVYEDETFEQLIDIHFAAYDLEAIVITSKEDIKYVGKYRLTYPTVINELHEILKRPIPESARLWSYQYRDFDTLGIMTRSGINDYFPNEIRDLKNNGFTISDIISAPAIEGNRSIILNGIIKAKKESEVYYYRCNFEFIAKRIPINDEELFEEFIRYPAEIYINSVLVTKLGVEEYSYASAVDLYMNY